MRIYDTLFVLFLVLWVDQSDAVASVATSGCASLVPSSTEFVLPATNFALTSLDVNYCRLRCATQNLE